jgi:hypothetical protein
MTTRLSSLGCRAQMTSNHLSIATLKFSPFSYSVTQQMNSKLKLWLDCGPVTIGTIINPSIALWLPSNRTPMFLSFLTSIHLFLWLSVLVNELTIHTMWAQLVRKWTVSHILAINILLWHQAHLHMILLSGSVLGKKNQTCNTHLQNPMNVIPFFFNHI